MKLAAMQSYFFPYLGYFQLIAAADVFILYDHVAYIRHGWVNRNRLLRVNSAPFFFVVPISKHPQQTPIRQIYIENTRAWRKHLCKLIESNYRRATFFEQVYPLVKQALNGREERLSDLNEATLRLVCNFLEITTPLIREHPAFEQIETELQATSPEANAPLERKTLRILKICHQFHANEYLNAIGGQTLYHRQNFAPNGIALKFIQTRPYQYSQRAQQFFPHLSILDVLMNCGKQGTQHLLQQYDLI